MSLVYVFLVNWNAHSNLLFCWWVVASWAFHINKISKPFWWLLGNWILDVEICFNWNEMFKKNGIWGINKMSFCGLSLRRNRQPKWKLSEFSSGFTVQIWVMLFPKRIHQRFVRKMYANYFTRCLFFSILRLLAFFFLNFSRVRFMVAVRCICLQFRDILFGNVQST